MARNSMLRVGSTLLILGIIASMFGLLMALHQTTIINYISNVIHDVNLVELIGMLIGLLGAVLIVTGVTMSVSSIIEVKLENERSYLISGLLPTLQDRIASTIALQVRAIARPQKCRFCGAQLGEGDTFCPSCGKSQM